MRVFEAEERDLIVRVLTAHGAPTENAAVQADWLVEADLRDHNSHGIRRLPILVERMRRGLLDPDAMGQLDWRTQSLLSVDGERGFGPVVASRAFRSAIERTATSGVTAVAIRNTNHLGILAPYVEAAAAAGMVGIGLTTSEALVHPWGGRTAMIGTNPLAIAVPTDSEPFVLDMATGIVSMGLVLHRAETSAELSDGWAVDAHGEPTTDPVAASTGSISPFGGAKGYALGLAFEVLVASLTGSALGREVRGTLDAVDEANKGDLLLCLDPAALDVGDVARRVTEYLDAVRSTPPQEGFDRVRIPGDRAREERRARVSNGYEIADSTWQAAADLLRLG